MKYERRSKDYHCEDSDFSKQCSGWNDFSNDFPELIKKWETEKIKYKNHGKFYETVESEMGKGVETLENGVEFLFPILVASAEFLFAQLNLQAEFKINTAKTEESLQKIKDDLRYISHCQFVGDIPPKIREVNSYTPTWILESMKKAGIIKNDVLYTIANEQIYLITALKSVNMWVFRCIPTSKLEIPLVRWDGEFLVAIPEKTQKILGNKLLALFGKTDA